jgi:hypothetical protein
MQVSRSHLLGTGLAITGLAAAVALGYAAPHLGKSFMSTRAGPNALASAAPSTAALERVADKRNVAPAAPADTGRTVRVEAPGTSVRVGKDTGRVAVNAPHTNVAVDPDKGRVRVRAPYVDLDIRW